MIWSLASPLNLLQPDGSFPSALALSARRLMLAAQWDEVSHLLSLALLPVAVWAMARALQHSRARDFAAAGLTLAVMMLANMFGVVLATMVTLTVPLALCPRLKPRLFLKSVAIGAATYIAISPWMTPSLLWSTHVNESLNGEARWSTAAVLALAGVILVVGLIHWWSRRRAYDWPARWLLITGATVLLIPAIAQFTGAHFLPQPMRYKVEAGIALVWIAVFASSSLIARLPMILRASAGVLLVVLAAHQAAVFRYSAEQMTQPIDFR